MNYQKLMRKEKALELVEFFKRVEKLNQLSNLYTQNNVVNSIQKESDLLEIEISAFKDESLYINDFYSELNNSLKMEFIADVHRQKNENGDKLNKETIKLKNFIKSANNMSSQHNIIEKKLKECHENIRREIDKKIQKDCI